MNSAGARWLHTAVWTGKEMIVWGGLLFSLNSPVGGRYNPLTDTWTAVSAVGAPPNRQWPVGVWTGSQMIVWGGENHNDGGRYTPATDKWTPTSLTGAPSPRTAQGVWTGKEMAIWGGAWDSSGGRYNPAADSWRPTTLRNAPLVRGGGRWSTVWTGTQMIVWGGVIETQKGSLYCASGQPNAAPVAADDSYAIAAGKALVVSNTAGVLANDSDANGDVLGAALVTKPAGALQLNSNGSFSYKPAPGFTGVDSFTYQANDGLTKSNTATVSITVQ